MSRRRVLIMGAAGRDFHNFNTVYREDETSRVVAFTATQIPNIANRRYPPELAGHLYPAGIPILPEAELEQAIHEFDVDEVVFAYSDVADTYVMQRAARVLATGADFRLLGPRHTMLPARVPVIAVTAVRTGCGKSQTSRYLGRLLRSLDLRVVAVRHPMPYGDLLRQQVQRFACFEDLLQADCTIEEREEYEPHIAAGLTVFAGADYGAILRAAEQEADLIIWDGGNNDLPFYRPDLLICVTDPHRAGHELRYYPGTTNLLMADIVVINKVDSAAPEQVAELRANIAQANPRANIIEAASPLSVEHPELIRGKRVLVVEDGPTVTHGGMQFGAGVLAAQRYGAAELVDPRPYAVGSIAAVYRDYPHLGALLPAMGYGEAQIQELAATISATPCDVVLIGTPIDLRRSVKLDRPALRVSYELEPRGEPGLEQLVNQLLERAQSR